MYMCTGFPYLLRPAAAVSRCVVQFMLSLSIQSDSGFENGLNLKSLVLECKRILIPLSSPIHNMFMFIVPVVLVGGNL